MTDTFVLEIVLILATLVIFMLYYWQQIQSCNKNIPNRRVMSNHYIDEQFIPIIQPDRILGPVKNFHQHFSKNDYKRLGWRNYYKSKNNTSNNVAPDDNFKGIPTRCHLDNMDSLTTNVKINKLINNSNPFNI